MYLHAAIYGICFTLGMVTGCLYPQPLEWGIALGAFAGYTLLKHYKKKEAQRMQSLVDTHLEKMQSLFGDRS